MKATFAALLAAASRKGCECQDHGRTGEHAAPAKACKIQFVHLPEMPATRPARAIMPGQDETLPFDNKLHEAAFKRQAIMA